MDSLRWKKAHLRTSMTFLQRCRDTDIIPNFLKLKRVFNTRQAHWIYNRMEKALLRERIHHNRKELALLDKRLLHIHLNISNRMAKTDWQKFDSISYHSMEKQMDINTERQRNKFNRLLPPEPSLSVPSRTVINLSEHQLTDDQTSILAKGGNFAITPKSVPTEEIIANTEAAITSLPDSKAEEIRSEVSRILRRSKPPKSNIKQREKQALKQLNNNKNIVILPADKGNATVIMETDDYKEKIRNLLEPTTYKKLEKDPTSKFLRQINNVVKSSTLPRDTIKSICKTEAVAPRLYGLPKIHKASVPLRPIVSAIGSPTYYIAKHMSKLLAAHTGKTDSYLKDSAHFIQKIQDLHLEPGDILVSFDVVSLFTRVPVNESLNYISEIFTKDLVDIFRACLSTSYFMWDGDFYEQIDGVAMGSPLSPVIANFYMERFEQLILESASLKPKVWLRYVDDTFVVWNHSEEELRFFSSTHKQQG